MTVTDTPPARVPTAVGKPILEARGVTMRFGGLTAVKDVDMTVNEGEIVGLIGPNGAARRRSSTASPVSTSRPRGRSR